MIGRILDNVVRRTVPFDGSALFVLDLDGRPSLVHDAYDGLQRGTALEHFLEGTFVLSPYYAAFKKGRLLPFGLARHYIDEQAQFSPSSEAVLYPHVSLQPDWLVDEACFSLVGERKCVIYLIMRAQSQTPFNANEIKELRAKSEKVCELLEHILTLYGDESISDRPSLKPALDKVVATDSVESAKKIESVFPESLSPREKVSVALTLQGKSVDAIAEELGISPHTVRVHMRNAYGKLQVRNRLELVGMFVRRAGFYTDQSRALAFAHEAG